MTRGRPDFVIVGAGFYGVGLAWLRIALKSAGGGL
jgi:hypothetical protein